MANHHTRQIPEPSDEQLQELQRWIRRTTTSQALALRARIILETTAGKSDMEVADELGTTRATVGKWRRRFLGDGCDGLLDEPRPGVPGTIGAEDVERVVVKTLESATAGCHALERRNQRHPDSQHQYRTSTTSDLPGSRSSVSHQATSFRRILIFGRQRHSVKRHQELTAVLGERRLTA